MDLSCLPSPNIVDLDKFINVDKVYYNDEKHLLRVLGGMEKENSENLEELKKILIDFSDNLINLSDDEFLKEGKTLVKTYIEGNVKIVVDKFINSCYVLGDGLYRKKMLEGDDSFFLESSFDGKEVLDSETDFILQYVSEIKNFWMLLDDENKFIIKTFLITICVFCDKRYLMLNNYMIMKEHNNNKFENVFKKFDGLLI